MTMTNVTCQVRVDGKLSGPLATTKRLRQGDRLACLILNLALERAIHDSRVEMDLAYADDINIIGLRLSYIAEAYQGIEQNEIAVQRGKGHTDGGNPTNNKSKLT